MFTSSKTPATQQRLTRKTTPEARPSDSGTFFSPSRLPFLLMSIPNRPACTDTGEHTLECCALRGTPRSKRCPGCYQMLRTFRVYRDTSGTMRSVPKKPSTCDLQGEGGCCKCTTSWAGNDAATSPQSQDAASINLPTQLRT